MHTFYAIWGLLIIPSFTNASIGINTEKLCELERLYNENATQIKCQVVGGIKDNKVKVSNRLDGVAGKLPYTTHPDAIYPGKNKSGRVYKELPTALSPL
jgi:hypothetical protein